MQCLRLEPSAAMLRYHDLPGAGMPILMLHGLGCAASFDFPRLAREPGLAGRRLLLVDLPGYGFSDKPDDFDYRTGSQARTLQTLIQKLELARIDLFGHSMGGSIAIELASLLPERIRALALAEPNLDAGGGAFSRAVASWSEAEYVTSGHQEIIDSCSDDNPQWAGCMAVASSLAVHRSARSLVAGPAVSWREQLLALKMPRCVIFGERSLPNPDSEWLPRHGIATRIVANAGHSMLWENPAGLAAAIGDALR